MRIATKLNAAVVLVLAATMLANYWALHAIVAPQFERIELRSAAVNHKRVLSEIGSISEKLRTISQDYAFWDELYDFMSDATEESQRAFLQTNMDPPADTFENLAVNAMAFRRLDGTMHWEAAFDFRTKLPIPGLAEEMGQVPFRHSMLGGGTDPMARAGLVRTSRGLMLVAVAPILKSGRRGTPMGELIVGSLLDVAAIEEATAVDFSIESVAAPISGVETAERTAKLAGTIETASALNGIDGAPLATLTSRKLRDVSQAGSAAIFSAMLLMMWAAAAVVVALWIFMRAIVIRRLDVLESHFVIAAETGELRKLEADRGLDEIGRLSRAFNTMADQVNALRDALADGAYLAGMSEWAAGTLHNVRNGITPVSVTAWRMQTVLDAPWLRNLRSAVEQDSRPNVPDERREKLKAYMVASAPRVIAAIDEAKELSRQIEGSSRAVMDIMSEFERFTRRESKVESVDLLALVGDVAGTILPAQSAPVALSTPDKSATVLVNRTVLRQVLSNVFINAVESITAHGQPGRIAVTWRECPASCDRLLVSITDNGEGIATERLKTIFEHGHSTRTFRSGGLGLHWCANAIKAQGGTITALSEGPGKGATLELTLPTLPVALKDAA